MDDIIRLYVELVPHLVSVLIIPNVIESFHFAFSSISSFERLSFQIIGRFDKS